MSVCSRSMMNAGCDSEMRVDAVVRLTELWRATAQNRLPIAARSSSATPSPGNRASIDSFLPPGLPCNGVLRSPPSHHEHTSAAAFQLSMLSPPHRLPVCFSCPDDVVDRPPACAAKTKCDSFLGV
uniref:Uncharacterized protein n=1 Tax=Plectus sambesii TaxID=2011161 RepID=A0A914WEL2_9BILA